MFQIYVYGSFIYFNLTQFAIDMTAIQNHSNLCNGSFKLKILKYIHILKILHYEKIYPQNVCAYVRCERPRVCQLHFIYPAKRGEQEAAKRIIAGSLGENDFN